MTERFYENRAIIAAHIRAPRTRMALALAGQLDVSEVLDVGAGIGDVSLALKDGTGANVICADISESAVEACRKRGFEAHRTELGETPLPFSDSRFDLVFMTEVLEHLVHPDRAMDEIRRILRPGGHLILSTPNLACLPNRFLLPIGLQPLFSEVSEDKNYGRGLVAFGQGGEPVGHLRLYTKRALKEFLSAKGFDLVKLRGAPFHWSGPWNLLERGVSTVPSLAFVLVGLARRSR